MFVNKPHGGQWGTKDHARSGQALARCPWTLRNRTASADFPHGVLVSVEPDNALGVSNVMQY